MKAFALCTRGLESGGGGGGGGGGVIHMLKRGNYNAVYINGGDLHIHTYV